MKNKNVGKCFPIYWKRRLKEIEIKEAIYKMYNAIKLISINKEEAGK